MILQIIIISGGVIGWLFFANFILDYFFPYRDETTFPILVAIGLRLILLVPVILLVKIAFNIGQKRVREHQVN